MKTFEIGKKYYDTSACDSNCVFVIEIVKRTEKTVTFKRDGEQRRAKLFVDKEGEYIIPERYSIAPVFRATREYQPEESSTPALEEPAVEPAEEQPQNASSNIVVLSQSTPDAGVVMLGQRVFRNCGACYPLEYGTVIRFVDVPAGRFFRGGVHAVVRWDSNDETPASTEQVQLSEIHPQGWRSAGGSPLGIFIAQ